MPGWSIVSVPGILGMVFITRIVIQTSSSDRAQPRHGPRSRLGGVLNFIVLSLMTTSLQTR